MPYVETGIQVAEELRALDLLEMGNIIHAAVAAAMATTLPVNPKNIQQKSHYNKLLDDYSQVMVGLHARATGTVGESFDAQGRGIIRRVNQLKDWLGRKWVV